MKKDYSELIVVLDESGSMGCVEDTIVRGLNEFIQEQQKVPGEAKMTLVTFSTTMRTKIDGEDIQKVKLLVKEDFNPSGSTALYDAVAKTIDNVGKRLADMPEDERPQSVIFQIITDGEENASREFTQKDVLDRITLQKEKYNWNFLFMAANIDASKAGNAIGINATLNFMSTDNSARGMSKAYSTYSKSLRSGGSSADALKDAQNQYNINSVP